MKFHVYHTVYQLSVIVMALGNSARGTCLSPLNEPGRKSGDSAEMATGSRDNLGLWGLGRSLSAGLVRSWNSCGQHWNSWKQLQSVERNWCDQMWLSKLGFVADLFGVPETPRNDKVNIKIFKCKKKHSTFNVQSKGVLKSKAASRGSLRRVSAVFTCRLSSLSCSWSSPTCPSSTWLVKSCGVKCQPQSSHILTNPFDHSSSWLLSDIVTSSAMA